MTSLAGEWSLPRHVGRDYLRQLTAEHREEIEDTKGHIGYEWVQVLKDNHLFDCEQMITVAAVVTKVIQVSSRQDVSVC